MKKYIAFLLTLALLVSVLAACGNQTVSQPESTAPETESSPAAPKALVAYFSRAGENYSVGVVETGSTEIVAELIAAGTGADLFHIQTVTAYPEDYEECTEVAKQERDANVRPELTAAVPSFEDYDVIYLGYPIWWGDMPMAVYTFLESYDFTGKTVRPFCTHAGSGLSNTVSTIRKACSDATVLDGLAIAGTTVQKDPDEAGKLVDTWLGA